MWWLFDELSQNKCHHHGICIKCAFMSIKLNKQQRLCMTMDGGRWVGPVRWLRPVIANARKKTVWKTIHLCALLVMRHNYLVECNEEKQVCSKHVKQTWFAQINLHWFYMILYSLEITCVVFAYVVTRVDLIASGDVRRRVSHFIQVTKTTHNWLCGNRDVKQWKMDVC